MIRILLIRALMALTGQREPSAKDFICEVYSESERRSLRRRSLPWVIIAAGLIAIAAFAIGYNEAQQRNAWQHASRTTAPTNAWDAMAATLGAGPGLYRAPGATYSITDNGQVYRVSLVVR
jgi:hypothetical protein